MSQQENSGDLNDTEVTWWELYDETHKRNYYFNTITEQTVWERPTNGNIVVPVIEDESSEKSKNTSEDEDPLDYLDENENTADGFGSDVATEFLEENVEKSPVTSPQTNQRFALPNVAIPPPNRRMPGAMRASPRVIPLERASMAPIPSPIIELPEISQPVLSGIHPQLAKSLKGVDIGRQSCPPPREYPLLDGWSEYYDKSSNSFYYENEEGQRTYDRDVACGLIPMVDISEDEESECSIQSPQLDIPREYPSLENPRLSEEERDAIKMTPSPIPKLSPKSPKTTASPIPSHLKAGNALSCPDSFSDTEMTPSGERRKKKRSKREKRPGKEKHGRSRRSQTTAPTNSAAQSSSEPVPLSEQPSLPNNLQEEINMFQLVGYAEKYFETHKRGIFRRQVPVKEMLCWTKEVIPTSLTRLPSESAAKEAVKNFKSIQIYAGDRPSKNDPIPVAQDIIGRAINRPELRDEIYCQLCKQSCYNPNKESNHKIWELFVLSSIYFPPSRDLERWLCSYIAEHLKLEVQQGDEKLPVFAKYVLKKLKIIIKAGPRGRLPTAREIERHRVAPFSHSVFGVTLEDIMELQAETYPNLKIPRIVISLSDAVSRLGGVDVEGIFRVPGDTEQVYALRIQLDNGNYEISLDDPNTPASLLKLWLRELEEPLIPVHLYDECIQSCMENENNTSAAIEVLERLPEVNKLTALYVVNYLKRVAENQEVNKMSINNLAMVFAPNFLRCPSEDPQIIFNNTKYEQAWLRALMNGEPPEPDIGSLE